MNNEPMHGADHGVAGSMPAFWQTAQPMVRPGGQQAAAPRSGSPAIDSPTGSSRPSGPPMAAYSAPAVTQMHSPMAAATRWAPHTGGYAAVHESQVLCAKARQAFVVSLIFFIPLAALGSLIIAGLAAKEIRESGGRLRGDGFVLTARILGWIGIALYAFWMTRYLV